MNIGTKWLRQVERVAAARIRRLLDAAERELGGLLPGARIERGAGELRVSARQLWRRWIAEPALRFLGWSLK